MPHAIINAITDIKEQIQTAQSRHQRSDDVQLLAVSKRHSSEKIRLAYQSGQRDFGENYLNEALQKQIELDDLDITWHYIGSIQSNKTRKMAAHFSWIHTVNSLKIATRLSNQRPHDLAPLNICLQINIDNETSKSGLPPDSAVLSELAREIHTLPHVVLRGLMCIPAPKEDPAQEKHTFRQMQTLLQQLNQDGHALDTLSMGMSDDLDTAIACGATIVRIGTAIFGQR